MKPHLVLICMIYCITCLDTAEQDQPSAEETVMLDLINRFRSSPAAEADRILLGIEAGISGMGNNLDVDACYRAIVSLKQAPPLVFNLQLQKMARQHARYLIQNNLTGHYQKPGNPGFTGESPRDRATAVGFTGYRLSENAFRNAVSIWNSHRGFIIDWGDGPGGMQDPPGHRLVLANPAHREIGCAYVPFDNGRHASVVHNLGDQKNIKRLVGGIVYRDENRNERYDIGEGLPNISLQCAEQETRSWRSGAFRIELPHNEKTVLLITINGKHFARTIEAGSENVYLQCIMPRPGDAIHMYKQIEQFKLHLDKMTRSVAINMWLATRGYYRSEEQDKLINQHCLTYAKEFELDKAMLLQIYYTGKPTAFKKFLQETRAKWETSDAARFFKDAETAFTVYYNTKDVIDKIRSRTPLLKGRFDQCIKDLKHTQTLLQDEQIIHSLHVLELMLTRSVTKKSG